MSLHTWVLLTSVKATKYYKYLLLVCKRKAITYFNHIRIPLLGVCFNTVFPCTTLHIIVNTSYATAMLLLNSFIQSLEWEGSIMSTKVFPECPGHDMNLCCKRHETNFRFQWDETFVCIVIAWITSFVISSHVALVSSHRINPQLHSISLMDIIWNVSVSCKCISEERDRRWHYTSMFVFMNGCNCRRDVK
jgi:hypothetical protein